MTASKRLFDHAGVFTDIHLGLKNNSIVHNEDCSRFVNFFIEEAGKRNCDTCIFMGDWHHNRNTVNTLTMKYSIEQLRKLSLSFKNFYFIEGNHDLYYRDRRDVTSVEFARLVNKINVIDRPIVVDDCAFVPWLIGDEWKGIPDLQARYMFGHFELPYFKMNAMVEMPDTGKIQYTNFMNQEYVFSGHFHKRQNKGRVHYIGNPFGHNYSDAGDFDRGAMFLEWGNEPEYVNWDCGPKYMVMNISDVISDTELILPKDSHVRIVLDVEVSYEEANFIKSTFVEQYGLRELTLIPKKNTDYANATIDRSHTESVDSIVINNLRSIDSKEFDSEVLVELYENL